MLTVMYRIVFYYCTCTTLLLGTLVYSKPHENNHGDGHPQILGHENEMIFSVRQPSDEHAIIEEEPVILDISTEVAKFILYFIKKYCKDNEKIGFLENMLKTKELKLNTNTNIEPSLAYFESNNPRKTLESTKPKQGHSINYKFATVPNYELKTPTIKTETKHKELMHRMELTTSNIPFSKTIQYQTPKFQLFNEEPSQVSFKEALPAAVSTTIEGPLIGKNNYEYEHEKPKVFVEPMYEYASHGDEYDYPMPDYDYSYQSISPKFSEIEPPQTEHSTNVLATHGWYKLYMNSLNNEQPSTMKSVDGPNFDFNEKKPGILQKIYKYFVPPQVEQGRRQQQQQHEILIEKPKYNSYKQQPSDNSFQKNKEPQAQVQFIDYKQPNNDDDGPKELSFSMQQQTDSPQVYFSHEPHMQQHDVLKFDKPKSEVIFKYNKDYSIPNVPPPQSADNWYNTVYEQQKIEPVTWKKSFHYTDPEDVKQFADSIYGYYNSILGNFKIYSKELNNLEFNKNTNKMNDVLSAWKSGDKFYDSAAMYNATTMMDKLVQANLDLDTKTQPPSIIETTTLSSQQQPTGKRRHFGVPLSEYLEDPEAKEDFGTLDPLLQNVIMAYLELKKDKQTPQITRTILFLLRKIKYIMTKYKKLFDHLNWVDDEIKNLSKNNMEIEQNVADVINKVLFNDLELLKHFNGMNFDINSRVFLTLFNIPITAQSKDALNDLVQNFLKGISKLSERDAEFKDLKFYIGEQKAIEQTSFFKRLMQFVVSPGDFLKMQDTETKMSENRRAFTEVKDTKTEMPIIVTTEPEIEETTTQQPTSTTPKKHIEKHHNIFREFLMDTDE